MGEEAGARIHGAGRLDGIGATAPLSERQGRSQASACAGVYAPGVGAGICGCAHCGGGRDSLYLGKTVENGRGDGRQLLRAGRALVAGYASSVANSAGVSGGDAHSNSVRASSFS